MEISQYLLDAADKILREEGCDSLPMQLSESAFWLTRGDDQSVIAFGAIKFEGNVYKIGPLRSGASF